MDRVSRDEFLAPGRDATRLFATKAADLVVVDEFARRRDRLPQQLGTPRFNNSRVTR